MWIALAYLCGILTGILGARCAENVAQKARQEMWQLAERQRVNDLVNGATCRHEKHSERGF